MTSPSAALTPLPPMEQRPADACRELRRRENTRGGYGANYVIRTCNYLVPGLHRLWLTFNIQMRAALALTPSTQQHVDPRPSNGLWETLLSSHCWARRGTHPKGGIWGNPPQGGGAWGTALQHMGLRALPPRGAPLWGLFVPSALRDLSEAAHVPHLPRTHPEWML